MVIYNIKYTLNTPCLIKPVFRLFFSFSIVQNFFKLIEIVQNKKFQHPCKFLKHTSAGTKVITLKLDCLEYFLIKKSFLPPFRRLTPTE